MIYEEADIALLAVGSMVKMAEKVRDVLKETGYSCTLVNVRFVKPIDEELLEDLAKNHRLAVTMEENVRNGGFGDHVLEYVSDRELPLQVLTVALPDEYVEHGNVEVLRREVGLDRDAIVKQVVTDYLTMRGE